MSVQLDVSGLKKSQLVVTPVAQEIHVDQTELQEMRPVREVLMARDLRLQIRRRFLKM
jgi:hypothetical protein